MKTFIGICITTASALFLIESSSVFAGSSISVSKIEHHLRLSNEHFDLNSLVWTFRNENASIKGRATVPGDIYTDLFNNNFIGNPLNANNDEKLRWIARLDWIYESEFYLPERWKMLRSVLLNAQGLDTVASVYLNEWKILRSNNQFHTFLVPLESWRAGRNSIRIHFKSPIHYAKRQSNEYHVTSHHDIPPICPPSIYRGDCHINFMRKIQSSFAWDWGPTFPTVGIWQAISLEAINEIFFERISAQVEPLQDRFLVRIELYLYSAITDDRVHGSVSIPELSLWVSFVEKLNKMRHNQFTVNLVVPKSSVQLWWPNGYGTQRLYLLNANIQRNDEIIHAKPIKIGFRSIELVQDLVDAEHPNKGRNFFFKINNVAIFLKGSNWIPVSSFPARNHTERIDFLLKSVVEANMNTLRVWGGGRYESDQFYESADQLGILIWHDLMFACALYPVDEHFRINVRKEIRTQIRRLRHHPSILLWSGNNENELAIRDKWWIVDNYHLKDMIADYKKLYVDTIQPLVLELDSSRPFILSSPSNGVQTEKEGGVAMEPNSARYGDIHFYNEIVDLWKDHVYLIPRCASEYGVQSMPMIETLMRYLNESQMSYTSESLVHRQHHPGGLFSLITMIFSHFRIPTECSSDYNVNNVHECEFARNSSTFLNRFIYLTQMHQAIAYQTQSEHYRRWRGRLNEDGFGNTMCSLYWQLNDIWAAPTWSTIDFDLSWKASHYFARRFFDKIIISLHLDESNVLQVFIVSDDMSTAPNCTITIDMLSWSNGFEPIYQQSKSVDIPAMSAISVEMFHSKDDMLSKYKMLSNQEEEFVIRGQLKKSDGTKIGYDAILLPNRLYKVDEQHFGEATIRSVQKVNESTYSIELVTDRITPLVWLQLLNSDGVQAHWFSDNAFTMTQPTKTVWLHLIKFDSKRPSIRFDDIRVCSLRNCGLQTFD